LRLLETKISEEDKEKVKQRIVSPESVDLIEDGFVQASRALSEERKEYIASLLKNSLTDDQLKYIEYKRLLSILGELNDLEVLILKSLTFLHGEEGSNEFWEKHEKALNEPIAYLGSPQEEWDKFEIYKTHKEHLVRLGLLKIRFKKPNKGEVPEFDEHTGMIKAQGYDITSLGELFLRSIE
jgi:sulfur relay (sulfurtransferase) DsrC/TusE family protein